MNPGLSFIILMFSFVLIVGGIQILVRKHFSHLDRYLFVFTFFIVLFSYSAGIEKIDTSLLTISGTIFIDFLFLIYVLTIDWWKLIKNLKKDK